MKTVAVVPINNLALAKSRLSGILSPEERRRLVFWMAARVLRTVQLSGVADTLLVISPDVGALEWAQAHGATAIQQDGGKLNAGLFQARRVALDVGAEALLVLLADLPLLTPGELRAFAALADTPPGSPVPPASPRPVSSPVAPRGEGVGSEVILAPDRRKVGTNGILLRPADAIPFAFGRASFGRHAELAATAGITPHIFASTGFAFDVDEPDDIETLRLRSSAFSDSKLHSGGNPGLWTPDTELAHLTLKEGV